MEFQIIFLNDLNPIHNITSKKDCYYYYYYFRTLEKEKCLENEVDKWKMDKFLDLSDNFLNVAKSYFRPIIR